MAFYDLHKTERAQLVKQIYQTILDALNEGQPESLLPYLSDADTYIRKNTYLILGKIYLQDEKLQKAILDLLKTYLGHEDFKVRQTVINAAGEIGKKHFSVVQYFFDQGLFDAHHVPRNAVIGSIKKMGEVNPNPVLEWASNYLLHPNKEIRREICHGIELRGRKHPEDILPLLKELQFDSTARVRNTLVHVLGQIAYKKGCLATVVSDLKTWENQELVKAALDEIIDVHHRYRSFAVLTQNEARDYIQRNFS